MSSKTCILPEDSRVFISLRLAVAAHCDSALYPLQARLPVLLSPSRRAYCVRLFNFIRLAAESSFEDSAICRLCCGHVGAESMTVHCRLCVRIILH